MSHPLDSDERNMRLPPFLLPKRSSMTFKNRLFLLLLLVISLQVVAIAVFVQFRLSDILDKEVGHRAILQAEQIASRPILIEAMEKHDYTTVRNYVDSLHNYYSDTNFIVIGDEHGIRVTHPDKDKIGYPMVGDDNSPALLHKKTYLSLREGSLGFGLRGKAPILNHQGNVIGVVSVGYLFTTIHSWHNLYLKPMIAMMVMMLISSIVGAYLFSNHIKKKMLNMEPEEIALSLRMESAILQSVYEGVVAVNNAGLIYSINQNAKQILGLENFEKPLENTPIDAVVEPHDFFIPTEREDESVKDEILLLNGQQVIASRTACQLDNKALGWVISFRNKDDIFTLSRQLSQVQQHTESLRVMRHEYANKLSTIAGLIQLGAYDDALKTIQQESSQKQQLIDFFVSHFDNNLVAGLLLSKHVRAKELGLNLEFDPTCYLDKRMPEHLSSDQLTSILGNLLDNAFEATIKNKASNREISLLITNASHELIIEVADNGIGIDDAMKEAIFERGVTTKAESGHGYGMYLINRYVTYAGGYITIDDNEAQGTIISIFIPIQSEAQNETV